MLLRDTYRNVKGSVGKLEKLGDAALVLAWPYITPGDAQTNMLWLDYLTNGQFTMRSAVGGVRDFMMPNLTHYLTALSRLLQSE